MVFNHRLEMPLSFTEENPIAAKMLSLDEATSHFFRERQRTSLYTGKAI
jgi:hypothetical protein